MDKEDDSSSLEPDGSDAFAFFAKSVLGIVPVAGSLLAEVAGGIIPNQRMDRLVRFASELEKRIKNLESSRIRSHLSDEEFTDLIEEAMRQAARSTTDERRQYIAALISNSLTDEEVAFAESKHLLRMLGDINDVEVVWLRSHARHFDGDDEFRSKHENILAYVPVYAGAADDAWDKKTLQDSYKEHLAQLGLLERRYKIDRKSGLPAFDNSGRMKVDGYDSTPLGRLLLTQIGFVDPHRREPS